MLKCPNCDERLRVSHVYSDAESRSETKTLKCDTCKKKFTQISMLVCEANATGLGAHAAHTRLQNGESPHDVAQDLSQKTV